MCIAWNLVSWRQAERFVVVCVFEGSSRGAGVRCPTRHPSKLPYGDGNSPPCAFAGHAREQWPLLWGARLSLAGLLRRLVRWKLLFRACGFLTTPGQCQRVGPLSAKASCFGGFCSQRGNTPFRTTQGLQVTAVETGRRHFFLPSGSCGGEDAQILTPHLGPTGLLQWHQLRQNMMPRGPAACLGTSLQQLV